MAEEAENTLKENWKEQLSFMAGRKGYVTIQQLADVLGTHRSTITGDIISGLIEGVLKKKGESSKSPVFIPLKSAFKYIDDHFHPFHEAPQGKGKNNQKKGSIVQLFNVPNRGKEKKPVQLSLFQNLQ